MVHKCKHRKQKEYLEGTIERSSREGSSVGAVEAEVEVEMPAGLEEDKEKTKSCRRRKKSKKCSRQSRKGESVERSAKTSDDQVYSKRTARKLELTFSGSEGEGKECPIHSKKREMEESSGYGKRKRSSRRSDTVDSGEDDKSSRGRRRSKKKCRRHMKKKGKISSARSSRSVGLRKRKLRSCKMDGVSQAEGSLKGGIDGKEVTMPPKKKKRLCRKHAKEREMEEKWKEAKKGEQSHLHRYLKSLVTPGRAPAPSGFSTPHHLPANRSNSHESLFGRSQARSQRSQHSVAQSKATASPAQHSYPSDSDSSYHRPSLIQYDKIWEWAMKTFDLMCRFPRVSVAFLVFLLIWWIWSQINFQFAYSAASVVKVGRPAAHWVSIYLESMAIRVAQFAASADEFIEAFHCDFARSWCRRFGLMCEVRCSFIDQAIQRIRLKP